MLKLRRFIVRRNCVLQCSDHAGAKVCSNFTNCKAPPSPPDAARMRSSKSGNRVEVVSCTWFHRKDGGICDITGFKTEMGRAIRSVRVSSCGLDCGIAAANKTNPGIPWHQATYTLCSAVVFSTRTTTRLDLVCCRYCGLC
jgi:hypothetical protein